MAGPRVAGVGPDGAPITLPAEKSKDLVASGGRVMSDEDARVDDAARAETEKPYDYVDAAKSFQHASGVGFGEAFGVPLDKAEIGIAGLFGKDSEKRARETLNGLNQRHPYVSTAGEIGGNVAGFMAASRASGIGAGTAGPGVAKVAQRMAVGGIENVIQATTKDVNEAALGDHEVNGEMLVANMPKHFVVGSLLTGAFEGGAHVLGKGVKAVTSRAVPALEEGASGAVGRELGLEGTEAVEAGAKVRGLNGGELPTSRGKLGEILTAEQAAQRGRSASMHAGVADALEGAQQGEASALAMRQEGARKGLGLASVKSATQAEGEAGAGIWDAAAGADAKVAEAESARAARIGEARAAHASAGEEALAAGERVGESRAAHEAGVAAVLEDTQRKVSQIADHYGNIHTSLQQEQAAAQRSLEEITAEHAAATRDLHQAIRDMGQGGTGKPYVPRSAKAGSKMNYAQRAPRVGDIDVETGQPWTKESLAEAAETFASWTGSESRIAEAARLTSLKKSLEDARAHAESHLGEVQKSIAGNATEARKAVRAATTEGASLVEQTKKTLSAPIENASKRSASAMRAVEEAQARVAQVEKETEEYVAKARGEGAGAVAKAEKRGAARIESAKADAAKARETFEAGASKEKEALAKSHGKQVKKLPELSTETDVDPLIKGMAERQSAMKAKPMVSGAAMMGAGLSLLHGNPVAAAGAIGSSFIAGQARNHGNLIAARMMRGLSTTLSSVDAAVRDGAARILAGTTGRAVKAATNADVEEKGHREPTFEELSKKLIDAQANPLELEHRVRESVGHIAIDAPGTYQEVLATTQRAQQFLLSILPIPQRDPNTLTPHLDPGDVGETARYEFMQSARTIDHPLSIFEDVQDGSITQSQVDAIQAVYPKLFDKMRSEVRRQTMYLAEPVDYEREIHVGVLLGQVTNQVLEPDFQSLMAKTYAEKSKQMDSPNASGGSGSKSAKNMMSGSESIEGGQ